LEGLRATFKPEFLNRVDDVIVFRRLSREDLSKIVDLQLVGVGRLLGERKLSLEVTPDAKALLLAEGYDPAYGARPLKRVIQRRIQNPVALAILGGDYGEGDRVRVERDGDTLAFVRVAGP
jgi:ATP-dependent Clp protease ATP-binding subunit ClpB